MINYVVLVLLFLLLVYIFHNSYSKKNILWVAYSTDNYEPLTKYWRDSLHDVIKNDTEHNHVIKHKIDKMPEKEETGVGKKSWYNCIIEQLIWATSFDENFIQKFEYVIVSDCDIQFFPNNSWKPLFEYIKRSNKSIFFMRENNSSDVNSGFYIIKNDYYETYVKFVKNMLDINDMYTDFGDQTYINNHRDELNFDYIPDEFVVWGREVNDKKVDKILLHHAVFNKSVKTKSEQIEFVRNYFSQQ